MSGIKLSHCLLTRDRVNGFKVAVLFFIAAGGWLLLDWTGFQNLDSAWIVLPLMPIVLIYIAELRGVYIWFRGMTLPSFCVLVATLALNWFFRAKSTLPDAVGYAVLVAFIAAGGFLMFRMWTYGAIERQDR